SFSYEDLWGWDIATRCWTRQRLVGNIPCPRSEMACTYNAALDKVIIFGGYAPSAPSQFDATDRTASMFTYYADTFVYGLDGTTGAVWKHVLTQGFPTPWALSVGAGDAWAPSRLLPLPRPHLSSAPVSPSPRSSLTRTCPFPVVHASPPLAGWVTKAKRSAVPFRRCFRRRR
ncbi:hypothetical protein B0H13DRAFT_1598731, partial [Mycena leptocephala]